MTNHNINKQKRNLLRRRLSAGILAALCAGTLMSCQVKPDGPYIPEDTPAASTSAADPAPEQPTEKTTEAVTAAPFDPNVRPDYAGRTTLDAPVASYNSGMYASPIDLTFEVPAGQYLYYTTDGSDPRTSSTAKLYTDALNIKDRSGSANVLHAIKPLRLSTDFLMNPWAACKTLVDKGTVVRACLANADGDFSPVTSHTYLIGLDNARYNDLVVVSLSTDYDNLFDNVNGIYVLGQVYADWKKENPKGEINGSTPANYNQRGKEWEREAYMEVFDTDGTVILSQGCGIRTQGGWSRSAWQKSFRMIARKSYGQGNFKAEVFPGLQKADGSEALTTFDTLLLRNGGNDSGFSKLKDTVLQSLVRHRDFETQTGRPAVLFLNGEYWGLYTLIEYYDADYFKNNYGVDPDNVLFYKNWDMDEGTEEDNSEFWQMMHTIKNADLNKEADLKKVQSMIDIDSFIDYMATEIYINNQDWPGGNFGMWRVRTPDPENPYADGRWHMTLFDTEYSTNMYGDAPAAKGCWMNDNLKRVLEEDCILSDIFRALMNNKTYEEQFANTLLDLMNVEYRFENYEKNLEYYKALYLPELARHFEAFPDWQSVENAALPTINRMSEFFTLRPTYVPEMLQKNFGYTGTAALVTVSSNIGTLELQLNSSKVSTAEAFTATYLTNYAVTLQALPVEGYRFTGWEFSLPGFTGDKTADTVCLHLTGDLNVRALYEAE